MVDAHRPELAGQSHARPGAQLVAMHAHGQAGGATGPQDHPGLVLGEGVRRQRLAEHIDIRGRTLGDDRRQHRPGHQIEVCRAVGGILGRHDVRSEEGDVRRDLAGQAQQSKLVLDAQPVTTLDLDGRRALTPQLGDPRGQQRAQLVVGRPARRRHSRRDPTPVVCRARHPGRELGRPVTGKDEVSVRVDEAGHDGAPAHVDARICLRGSAGRAYPDNLPGLDEDGRVGDDPQPSNVGRLARSRPARIVGDELGDPRDEGCGHEAAPSSRAEMASVKSRPTSPSRCCPAETTTSPPTTTVVTSAPVAA